MIEQHLPVLLIVLPLITAPFCLLFRRSDLAWFLSLLVSIASLVMSINLFFLVKETSLIQYDIGNWAAPWGIQISVDYLNSFVLLIITGASVLTSICAKESISKEIATDRIYLFYSAYLLNLTGLTGVVLTGDAFNLFVFIEIASLSSYCLISLGRDKRALYAAYRYLIMGTIGATFILIGLGLLYVMTGTLNMHDLADRIPDVKQTGTVFTAACFILIGACLKLALFPMHVWLPAAYTYAPSIISVFLAATTTKVFVYVLIRYLFTIFGIKYITTLQLPYVLMVLSCMAILYGSYKAIKESNIKTIFAFSSVAQIGYMILGLSLVSIFGLTASIMHLFNHALMKSTLFVAVACIVYRIGSTNLADMKGMFKNMPLSSSALLIGGLSLIGIPGTAGFISKWYLITAAIEQQYWLIIAVVLFGSLLSVVYIWKIIEIFYFQPGTESVSGNKRQEAPASMLIPLCLLGLANIYFGIDTSFSFGAAEGAARQLMAIGYE